MDTKEMALIFYMKAIKEHFGSIAKLAKQLGVNRQAIYFWHYDGGVPKYRSVQIDQLSEGRVKAPRAIIRSSNYSRNGKRAVA